MKEWVEKRLTYLPSNVSPEKWLLECCHRSKKKENLARRWGVDDVKVVEAALELARCAPAHDEFFTLGRQMQLPEDRVLGDVIQFLSLSRTNELQEIEECIKSLLDELN